MTSARRFGKLAFAKQVSLGTAAAAPLFSVPMISGAINPVKDVADLPRQGGTMARLGRYVQRARGEGTITTLCHPEALGLLLFYAMGTQVSQVGGPAPYSHTFTMSDDYPGDGMTFWSSIGPESSAISGSAWKFADTFIQRLQIMGKSGDNLVVELGITSFDYTAITTIPAVSGTGASAEDDEPRFKYIGSEVSLSPNSNAWTQMDNSESVTFEIDRAPEYRYGPSLTPTVVAPDRMVNLTVGLTYDDALGGWDYLRAAYTGSITGTGPEQSIAQGSANVKFGRHPSSVSRFLQITSNGYNWQYTTTRPDAEATPGIIEYELNGILVSPNAAEGGSGDREVTVVLENDFSGDY